MFSRDLDWSDLPNSLRDLVEPAMRYGDVVLSEERDAVIGSLASGERIALRRLADKIRMHRSELEAWLATRSWSDAAVRRVCWLLELLEAIHPESLPVVSPAFARTGELAQALSGVRWDWRSDSMHSRMCALGAARTGSNTYVLQTGHELTLEGDGRRITALEVYIAARDDLDRLGTGERQVALRHMDSLLTSVLAQIEERLGTSARAVASGGSQARWPLGSAMLMLQLWRVPNLPMIVLRLRLEPADWPVASATACAW